MNMSITFQQAGGAVRCAGAIALLGLLSAPPFAQPPDKAGETDAKPPLEKLTTKDLIGKLQEESAQGIGTHATAWASGFIAIDEDPEFRGGILGSKKPATSPVLRELVRRGVAALPTLLDHVDDKRPTKLVIEHKGFVGAMWHSDEYDPRYTDPKKQPAKVNSNLREGVKNDTKYTLSVGDLCFVAVGQIVNRELHVVRYQPTACLVINSPIVTPALADAVRRDWKGLTAEQHQQSLLEDAQNGVKAAFARLLYYYPAWGRSQVLRMLDRPLYDYILVGNFVLQKLVPAKGDEQRRQLIAEFRRTHGEAAYRGLVHVLVEWSTSIDEQSKQMKQVEDDLLSRYFPWVDPFSPPFLDAVSYLRQQRLIEGLAAFRKPEFDSGVRDVFRRCVSRKPLSLSESLAQVDLATACAQSVPPDELGRLLATRLREFKEALKDPANAAIHQELTNCLGRIEEAAKRIQNEENKQDGTK